MVTVYESKFSELKILYHTAAAILTVRNAKQRQDRVSVSETGRFYGQKSVRYHEMELEK